MSALLIDLFSYQYLLWLKQQTLYAALLFIPIVLFQQLAFRRWPQWVYGLWLLFMLRLLLPADLASEYSLRNILQPLLAQPAPILEQFMHSRQQVFNAWGASLLPALQWLRWNTLLAALLLAVGLLRLWRAALLNRRLQRLLRESQPLPVQHSGWQLLQQWRRQWLLRRPIHLLTGDGFSQPFSCGIWRPAVYLPAALLRQLNEGQLRALIGHEVAHIRRWDALLLPLQRLLDSLFWFNPLWWYCQQQLGQMRELRCDQMVLASGLVSARDYGDAMIACVAQPTAVPGLRFLPSRFRQLAQRLQLLDRHRRQSKLFATSLLLSLLTAAVLILPMAPAGGQASLAQQQLALADHHRKVARHLPRLSPPVAGELVSPFGLRRSHSGIDLLREWHIHSGLDFSAALTAPVRAAAKGVVLRAQPLNSDVRSSIGGGYVVLGHGRQLATFYGPLNDIQVSPGQSVSAGALLGLVGEGALRSGGHHLHFELLIEDVPVDPGCQLAIGCTLVLED